MVEQSVSADGDDILTPEEARRFLKVSLRWLMREGIGKSGVPFVRPPHSNLTRFRKSALLAWAEANEQNDNRGSGFGGYRPNQIPRIQRERKWLEMAAADPTFRSAVLAWVMRGRAPWMKHGIGSTPLIQKATAKVRRSMDSLAYFWAE